MIIGQKIRKNVIYIPNKTREALEYIDIKELIKVDKDIDIAKEIILIFLSNFCSTEFKEKKSIRLYSKLMKKIYGKKFYRVNGKKKEDIRYPIIIEILKTGTELKGGIIEQTGNHSKIKKVSKQYSLTPNYLDKGIQSYELKTDRALMLIEKDFNNRMKLVNCNIIVSNLLEAYKHMSVPSLEEVKRKGMEQIEEKKKLKRGKIMVLNTSDKKDENNVSLEEHLKIYDYCFSNGLMLPSISSDYKRVTDSINICPTWIRGMILLDSEETVPVDYSSMHPHLAMFLYENEALRKNNDHDVVAKYLDMDRNVVKAEHNAFFNMKKWQMESSFIYDYYKTHHPKMLDKIIKIKEKNYKLVTKELFGLEVQIMTEAIKRLNEINIYPLYVYDELLSKKSEADIVRNVMNDVVKEMGIMTIAK